VLARITTNPLLTAFAAFVLATAIVVALTRGAYLRSDFLEGILIEAHGMLLDILVIGIFILWLNRLGEKRVEVRRYEEEIDDFRGWDSDEASHRIAGNVRRLNDRGVSTINLHRCHLSNAVLPQTNLSGADLSHANLSGADLSTADLSTADLSGANLSNAYLSNACLSGANLSGANLSGAYLSHANLSHANLGGTNLNNRQLAQAMSLIGATMPDESKMTEEQWERFKEQRR